MEAPLHEFKIVVAGPFGVGKTTMIENISGEPVVGTEVATTGDEALQKDFTTVGIEHGVLHVKAQDFNIRLTLIGTPGQARFRFMWDAALIGTDGVVALVDATRPDTWLDAAEAVAYFALDHSDRLVVGANRAKPGTAELVRLSKHLDEVPGFDSTAVPVIPCDVVEPESSKALLVALIERLLASPTLLEESRTRDHSGNAQAHAAL